MDPTIGRASGYDHLSDAEIRNKISNREQTVQFFLSEAEANSAGLGDVQAQLDSLYQEIDNLSAVLRSRQIHRVVPDSAGQAQPESMWTRAFHAVSNLFGYENAAPKLVSVAGPNDVPVYVFRTMTAKLLQLTFDVNVATVRQVKECIAEELKCPLEDIHILCMGEFMKDEAHFKESDLMEGPAHIVLRKLPSSVEADSADLPVHYFRTIDGKLLTLHFDPKVATVKDVKEIIAKKERCSVEQVHIICKGKLMGDDALFTEDDLDKPFISVRRSAIGEERKE